MRKILLFLWCLGIAEYGKSITLDLNHSRSLLKQSIKSKKVIRESRFSKDVSFKKGFNLFGNHIIDMDQSLRDYLADKNLNPYFQIRRAKSEVKGSLTVGQYDFFVNGHKICKGFVHSVEHRESNPSVMGVLPDGDFVNTRHDVFQWPGEDQLQITLKTMLNNHDIEIKFLNKENCLHPDRDNILRPMVQAIAFINSLSYKVILSEYEVADFSENFFHGTGTVSVYEKNPEESELTSQSVTGLLDNGYMETQYLKTDMVTNARAYSGTNKFEYFEFEFSNDSRIHETNLFYHTHKSLTWFESVGYKWHMPDKKINIVGRLGVEPDPDLSNNAFYTPVASDGAPMIYVHQGDGIILKNLTLDGDVVSHEFAHHVIFQSVHDTDVQESVIIHEGLADFFTFARTGSDCLGESICPTNSGACIVNGSCLRTAANLLKYNDQFYKSFGEFSHLKGQLISAFLLDIINAGKLSADELSKVVLKAVEILPRTSYLDDLLMSLMQADETLNNGVNTCMFEQFAAARNLDQRLPSDFDCSEYGGLTSDDIAVKANTDANTPPTDNNTATSNNDSNTNANTSTDTTTASSSKTNARTSKDAPDRSGGASCGTIDFAALGRFGKLLIFMWFIPLLVPFSFRKTRENRGSFLER